MSFLQSIQEVETPGRTPGAVDLREQQAGQQAATKLATPEQIRKAGRAAATPTGKAFVGRLREGDPYPDPGPGGSRHTEDDLAFPSTNARFCRTLREGDAGIETTEQQRAQKNRRFVRELRE